MERCFENGCMWECDPLGEWNPIRIGTFKEVLASLVLAEDKLAHRWDLPDASGGTRRIQIMRAVNRCGPRALEDDDIRAWEDAYYDYIGWVEHLGPS